MRWTSAILFAALAAAQTRQVALTFDDAPRGGDSPSGRQLTATLTLTQELIRQLDQIPATIFADYPKLTGVFNAVSGHPGVKIWNAKSLQP